MDWEMKPLNTGTARKQGRELCEWARMNLRYRGFCVFRVFRGRSKTRNPQFPSLGPAFTLIEFIGVVAVLAIVAAVLTPVAIRRIDEAARTREASDLVAISNSLTLQLVRSNTISSAATWAANAANFSGLSASGIAQNPRGYGRVLFVDGAGWLATNVPYAQTSQGTATAPAQARMLLVSCLSGTNGVSQTGGVLASNLFADIWNTPPRTPPSTWTGWKGNPQDLVIQRINFQPFFHRVLMFNNVSNTPCSYTLNGSTNVPLQYEVASYFIDGSSLGMYTNAGLQFTEVINHDFSILFDGNLFSDQPGPGPGTVGSTNLDNIAYAFINSASPSFTQRGDNTYGIAGALLAYMTSYSAWASMSPCFSFLGQGNSKFVPEALVINTIVNCFATKGTSGCLIVP